jgi:hypothetical protein
MHSAESRLCAVMHSAESTPFCAALRGVETKNVAKNSALCITHAVMHSEEFFGTVRSRITNVSAFITAVKATV